MTADFGLGVCGIGDILTTVSGGYGIDYISFPDSGHFQGDSQTLQDSGRKISAGLSHVMADQIFVGIEDGHFGPRSPDIGTNIYWVCTHSFTEFRFWSQ
jgi:hypothetical protein